MYIPALTSPHLTSSHLLNARPLTPLLSPPFSLAALEASDGAAEATAVLRRCVLALAPLAGHASPAVRSAHLSLLVGVLRARPELIPSPLGTGAPRPGEAAEEAEGAVAGAGEWAGMEGAPSGQAGAAAASGRARGGRASGPFVGFGGGFRQSPSGLFGGGGGGNGGDDDVAAYEAAVAGPLLLAAAADASPELRHAARRLLHALLPAGVSRDTSPDAYICVCVCVCVCRASSFPSSFGLSARRSSCCTPCCPGKPCACGRHARGE